MGIVSCLGGAVAQLGERRVRNAKVGSSILLGSTKTERLSCAVLGSAAPGEMGRYAVSLIEIHTPGPPTAEAAIYHSFSQLRVLLMLLRSYRFIHHHSVLLVSD